MRSLDGRRIGPYELASRIGSGGMGVVYKARDTRLDRTVAIKVLTPDALDDPHARERFDREGRAIAALNDPHICALYDIGETTFEPAADGTTETVRFLVMEYLEGETLASRLTRGPLPVDEALRYAEHVTSALERAHRAGIVHRDLKPGNIFLVPAVGSSVSTAKLLDFGLAKTDHAAAAGDVTRLAPTELTTLGTMLGTVQYMAPEQIEGKPADARADIFALGTVLFEMLTGRKAFTGENQASLMVAILHDEPPILPPTIPEAPSIQAILRRCLAKRPTDRWQSASDVLHAIRPLRESTASHTIASTARPTTNRSRIRYAFAAATLVVIALALTLAGRSRGWFTAASPVGIQRATLAVLPLRFVDPNSDSAHLGVGIADAIVTKLANVQSIRVRPTSAIVSFENRVVDPAEVARQLQVDHVLTGTMHRADDAYRFNLQLTRASDGVVVWGRQIDVNARGLFGVEDQVSADVVAALQLEISKGERERLSQRYTQNALAYDEYLKGRALLANYSDTNIRDAMIHFERALQIDQNYVLADAGLAVAAGIRSLRFADGDQDAREWGRRASEYASRALRRDGNLAEAHLALASAAGTLHGNFDWATAIHEADLALRLNPNLDLAHAALSRAFYHLGQLDWSDLEATRAQEISGGTNLEVSRVQVYALFLDGRYDAARVMAEKLLARTEVSIVRQYHGLALFYVGERAKGIDVLANVRRPDGKPDPRVQSSLAALLAAAGRRDDAEGTMRRVIDSGYMDHHVAYALGVASAQLGRPVEAMKWLRQAVETGFPCYPWMARDALLDPIRSSDEFKAFLVSLRNDFDRARTRYQSVLRNY